MEAELESELAEELRSCDAYEQGQMNIKVETYLADLETEGEALEADLEARS